MNLTDISLKNLMRRKAKAGFIMTGLVVGVAAMVAVIGFVRTMTAEISHKMERYGANILVLPKTEDLQLSYGGLNLGGVSFDVEPIRQEDLLRLRTIKNAANIAATGPTLLGVVEANGRRVLLAGIDLESVRILKPWWRLNGGPPGADGLLAGAETARILNLAIGSEVTVNGRRMPVVGILEATGSQDDSLLFAELTTAQDILGRQGQISMVEVAALCNACPIDEMVSQIAGALPDAKVMAIQQVVKGRMATLHRFSTFSLGMSIVVILVGSLVVLTTMMSSVRERREEIGIFRAMGFRRSHVMGIIFSEAAILSGPAGLIGYLAGTAATYAGVRLFSGLDHASIALDPALCGAAVLLAMVVGLSASVYPAVMAARLDPNTALRSL
ncbi:ABC transporter permease [Desulfosarcina alkanivorans]|jgi:putative ABC transport system permease protein|uniref:ABC transporter permease n=1 Tax=Desulfosarcina alkanivorans TaxID=571177 RepID=A0A5K7YQP9_9BACT|nr:FtsX-like permease family protein [Desulfosarcina alkanivorans]BBO71576.1 ABC transporter permease [Desulfosarcina alkanivorans]